MVPRPPLVTSERGLSCLKYWASHIWCWPTSVTMMVSVETAGGRAASRQISLMTWRGVEVAVVGEGEDVADGGGAL